MIEGWGFNPPPHWPEPPRGWMPPPGWIPDPRWGPVPPGWQLWVPARRARRRPAVLPTAVLGSVLLIAVVGTFVPRVAGPSDGRAGGVEIMRAQAVAPARLLPAAGAESAAEPGAGPGTEPVAIPGTEPATAPGSESVAAAGRRFDSCADLNRVYPKGVGMLDAVDRTKAADPVTDFGRSTSLYRANLRHDRDGDGIACEPA